MINEKKYIKVKTEGSFSLQDIAAEYDLTPVELVTFHNQHCTLHELLPLSLPKYVEYIYLPPQNFLERDQKLLKSINLSLPQQSSEKTYGVMLKFLPKDLNMHYIIKAKRTSQFLEITKEKTFDPLFGFEIKYDAYQLLYKIKHPVVLAVVATLDILDETLGDNFNIDLNLIVTSEINGSLKGTINTANGSNYTERLMKDEDDTPCKFGGKVEISLRGYIQVNGPIQTFLFGKYDFYGELTADATTGISAEFQVKADESSIFIQPEIKFEGFILGGSFKAGAVKPKRGTENITIEELKEADGLHYAAKGKIVVLDPYEWETGWKLPIMSFK